MKGLMKLQKSWHMLLVAVVAMLPIALTGCQVDVGGQTLPSAYYTQDDVQFFPEGPEFKLSREAAAINEATQEEGLGLQ